VTDVLAVLTFRHGGTMYATLDEFNNDLDRLGRYESVTFIPAAEIGLTKYEAAKGPHSLTVWAFDETSPIKAAAGTQAVPYSSHHGLISVAWLRSQGWTVTDAAISND
jgi:hypothetical protein